MNEDGFLSARPRESRIFDRQSDEWYVEPHWVSRRLFEVEGFGGGILDPACGRGNILESAQAAGLPALGFDVAKRGVGLGAHGFDFLSSDFPSECIAPASGEVRHVCSNPPFLLGRQFAERALDLISFGDKVALVFPIRRLNAAGAWLKRTPLARIWFLTPRPSMPPGEMFEELAARGKEPSGGTQDFCWLIWVKGFKGEPSVRWLNKKAQS